MRVLLLGMLATGCARPQPEQQFGLAPPQVVVSRSMLPFAAGLDQDLVRCRQRPDGGLVTGPSRRSGRSSTPSARSSPRSCGEEVRNHVDRADGHRT